MAKNIFNSIQVRKPQSSTFDMSHDVKLSFDMGKLVPVACMEVIPGDVWNIQTETLIRFAPMVAPVMHKMNVHTHWFFVPNRITWPNWEKFITATNKQGQSEIPSPPYLHFEDDTFPNPSNIYEVKKGSLADYLGLPLGEIDTEKERISMLPFAAYAAIFDEYYRDQNLQRAIKEFRHDGEYYLNDGANIVGTASYEDGILDFCAMQNRAWQHDYFTASLPFAQKGEAVEIPLFPDGIQMAVFRNNSEQGEPRVNWTGEVDGTSDPADLNVAGTIRSQLDWLPNDSLFAATNTEQDEGMTAASINDLRRAFRLQEWLEKMARGGSRYIEQILVHFGVKSSDARLQRPEFLGGSKNPVIISEVLQTSEQVDSTPLATMAGHGISAGRGKQIRYRAEEHGYIIGIMSVTPLTAYQQGIHRHWTRRSYLDYAWPSFAHIGEQEVLNKELYYDHELADNDDTFGYVPRYSEYRYMDSRVSGDFRDNLAFWHLGRIFDERPALNADFIKCEPRKDIFAVQDEDTQSLWSHVFHSIRVNRRLPKYGTPTL